MMSLFIQTGIRILIIAIIVYIAWNGMELKVGDNFSFKIYPLKRFFD